MTTNTTEKSRGQKAATTRADNKEKAQAILNAKPKAVPVIPAHDPTKATAGKVDSDKVVAEAAKVTDASNQAIQSQEAKALSIILREAKATYKRHASQDATQAQKINRSCFAYLESLAADAERHQLVAPQFDPNKLKSDLYQLAAYDPADKENKLPAFEMAVLRSIRAAMLAWSPATVFKMTMEGDLTAPSNALVPVLEQTDKNGNKQDIPNKDTMHVPVAVRAYTGHFSNSFPGLMTGKSGTRKSRVQVAEDKAVAKASGDFVATIKAVQDYMRSNAKGQPGYLIIMDGDGSLYDIMDDIATMAMTLTDAADKRREEATANKAAAEGETLEGETPEEMDAAAKAEAA